MSTLLGVSPRCFIQTAATTLLIAASMLTPTTATGIAEAEPRTITVLQLNLCNSGHAPCYEEVNRNESVREAIDEIKKIEPKPDVITLNEVCRKDVTNIARATGYPTDYDADHYNFFPVLRRNDDGSTTNYKCTDNADGNDGQRTGYETEDFGIGILVRNHGYPMTSYWAPYPESMQDTSSHEVRVMACSEYYRLNLNVCTTHLVVGAETTALKQCEWLREIAANFARERPTVVAGDFNLKYDENVQKCVPESFFRKGDGNVQHVMASEHFEFVSMRKIPLKRTDHEGLMVTIRIT
ncbi:MAG: endonuclease/exonuclease/phosphatase family protein [Pseudonocardiales bacterium]